ncbi:PREDICTED: structure-specific endonuclease subunit slx1-like isoform X2 [Priapulus caudatus]|uniref:Structure-specific endonuclease subunit SLX1 homolog n=1 Tax=Priapulus caudatus TaxID=37621 RepID=A0ABM1DP33_PRICU|nr:PREDICTED: structure-specific endonuclease subunit slx1-like isoform X2 [Priapulus caudatus]
MPDHSTVENLFGCYLLYCRNERYKGQTYIGFTNNPTRRIRQHNNGTKAGGAYRTSNKGPWDMVLMIHGFPTKISALRFEWAWQHPKKSRRLHHLPGKRSSEKKFEYCFRVVCEMLRTAPWERLPLTIRWLKQEYQLDFPVGREPPTHMPMAYGVVFNKKVKPAERIETNSQPQQAATSDSDLPSLSISSTCQRCAVCVKKLRPDANTISCLAPTCNMKSHVICLASNFLKYTKESDSQQILPVEGKCPRCKIEVLWGDLIRHKQGCYQDIQVEENTGSSEDDVWQRS